MKRFRIGLALLFLSSLTLRADGSSYSLDLNLSPTGQSVAGESRVGAVVLSDQQAKELRSLLKVPCS